MDHEFIRTRDILHKTRQHLPLLWYPNTRAAVGACIFIWYNFARYFPIVRLTTSVQDTDAMNTIPRRGLRVAINI